MKRRSFLATSSAGFLAGCNTTQESVETDIQESANNRASVEDQTGQPAEQMESEADISIESDEWVEEGESVEYIVENRGEGQSGSIYLVTRWYDDDGNYIGSDQASIPTLHSGKKWSVEIEATVPFEAVEYDAYAEFETQYSYEELETRSVRVNLQDPAVTGIVSHNEGEEAEILIQAVTYDSEWITHSGIVDDYNIPDKDWRFYLPLVRVSNTSNRSGTDLELMFTVG